jgi:hypothetical protein
MTERDTGEVVDRELEGYVEAVTARLGGIPDRDEAVDELRGHLAEVRAEHAGVALRDVLGEPAAYAEELRTAAGLPPHSHERGAFSARLSALATTVRLQASGFARDLRAFWWGLRGLALGLFAFVFWSGLGEALYWNDYVGGWRYRLTPSSAYGAIVAAWGWAEHMTLLVVLLVLGLVISVWLGGGQATGRWPRWLTTAIGVVGILLGLWLALVFWELMTTAVFASLAPPLDAPG